MRNGGLQEYNRKRDFKITREPSGKKARSRTKKLLFVVQEHHASHLHYDFRLEWDGVLKSWAVPKGPSLDPADKRLAVEVEDHPLPYAKFVGVIPEGEYGGGQVYRYDMGEWIPKNEDVDADLRKGRLEFSLKGGKLNGDWILVRTRRGSGKPQWLLIKRHDDFAVEGAELERVADYGTSSEYAKVEGLVDSPAQALKKFGKVKTKSSAPVKEKVWHSNRAAKKASGKKAAVAAKKSAPVRAPAKRKRAKGVADLPEFVAPQLAQLVNKVPTGPDWVHEMKFDGYRIQVHIEDGRVRMYTRNGHDWTAKYASLAKSMEKLGVQNAILDGEVVWQDDKGRSNFQKLQNAMKSARTDALVYWAFDILFCDGENLMEQPLLERKEVLEELIRDLDDEHIRFSEHFKTGGEKLFEQMCSLDMEGIISKRVDLPYAPKQRGDWVKVKCSKRQEFVIGGFTEGEGSRIGFGSLLLGYYSDGELTYAGKVGTGFDQRMLEDIRKKLNKLAAKSSPFVHGSPRGARNHWIKPKLVAEVGFAEWTADKHLRVPVFFGMRSDKDPKEITIEKPKQVVADHIVNKEVTRKNEPKARKAAKPKASARKAGFKRAAKPARASSGEPTVTHPDRVIYAGEDLTKLDVAKYYQAVAQWMVPHLADRPLSLLRCTDSAVKGCFFNKHFPGKMPESLIEVPEKGKDPFFAIDSYEGLAAIVQYGALEIHPWQCHRDDIEAPDQIVLDFDPDPKMDFKIVKDGAMEVREILQQLGIKSWVKTTGGKGLHVQFPFEPLYDWDSVKSFSKTIVQEMVSRHPDHYTANMSMKQRKGKIFLDYLRNGRGATAVAPYSLRAKDVSAVAMPIDWKDLKTLKAANVFTLEKALAHLKKRKVDPWRDFFKTKQKIRLLS